jgi:hypothetical protein
MLMKNDAAPRAIHPFPWKCAECGQPQVFPVEEDYAGEMLHDGRMYRFTVPALRLFRCRNCGEGVLDTAASERITAAFRQQADIDLRHTSV